MSWRCVKFIFKKKEYDVHKEEIMKCINEAHGEESYAGGAGIMEYTHQLDKRIYEIETLERLVGEPCVYFDTEEFFAYCSSPNYTLQSLLKKKKIEFATW